MMAIKDKVSRETGSICRLAVIATHFIQYQAPIWRELAKYPDIELTVYYLSDRGRKLSYDVQFGETFTWDIPLDQGYRWELLPVTTSTWSLAAAQLVFRDAADVYLRSDYDTLGAVAFFYACKLKGVPVLYRGDTTLLHENKRWLDLKRMLLFPVFQSSVYSLAVGKLAGEYALSMGVPMDRIVFSPHNVDTPYWTTSALKESPRKKEQHRRFGFPENVSVILFCGKLIEVKRPLDLAQAMSRLSSKRPVGFLVAGAGAQQGQMQDILSGCRDLYVHFTGFVNQSKLPEIYSAADVICLPSASETWGLVINEAMYFGCVPVVSDMVGCAPDLVAEVGEIHPVGDIDAIVSNLEHVLDTLPHRKALIAERIKHYSLKRAVASIAQTVLFAAGENRP